MSVHKQPNGKWKVGYREYGGKQRWETYDRKSDADARDVEIKRAKQLGQPLRENFRKASLTFDDFAVEWMELDALPRLAPKTVKEYAYQLDKYLSPAIGNEPLTHIDARRSLQLRADLKANGVPDYTAARVLKLFRQIMGFAVGMGHFLYNPADVLRGKGQLPSEARQGDVRPMTPDEIEQLRAAILVRRSPHALRDATLVSVLAYAGLRPEEALALAWEHVQPTFLRIVRANVDGNVTAKTKNGKHRTVHHLVDALGEDLETWRAAHPDPQPDALVFPRSDGDGWTREDYNNWRGRVFRKLAPKGTVPYSLRHGHASMLVREGWDRAKLAQRMGHTATMTEKHYTHIFEAFEGQPFVPMEKLVAEARRKAAVSPVFPDQPRNKTPKTTQAARKAA